MQLSKLVIHKCPYTGKISRTVQTYFCMYCGNQHRGRRPKKCGQVADAVKHLFANGYAAWHIMRLLETYGTDLPNYVNTKS